MQCKGQRGDGKTFQKNHNSIQKEKENCYWSQPQSFTDHNLCQIDNNYFLSYFRKINLKILSAWYSYNVYKTAAYIKIKWVTKGNVLVCSSCQKCEFQMFSWMDESVPYWLVYMYPKLSEPALRMRWSSAVFVSNMSSCEFIESLHQFSGFRWNENTKQTVGWALWGFPALRLSFIY